MTDFEKVIASNIRKTIKQVIGSGTVGMAVKNLLQITPTPNPNLDGAPTGTGQQIIDDYRSMFERIAKTIKVKGFSIYD